LRFRHELLALDFEVKATPNADAAAAADAGALPTHLDARGTWSGAPFAIDASTADTITLLETGRTFRVRGRVTSGDARVDVDGALGDIVRWPQVDAHVDLAAASLPRLVALFTGRTNATASAPLRVEGALRGDVDSYVLAAS